MSIHLVLLLLLFKNIFIIISFYILVQVKQKIHFSQDRIIGGVYMIKICYVHTQKCLNKTCKIKLAYTIENTEFIFSASS